MMPLLLKAIRHQDLKFISKNIMGKAPLQRLVRMLLVPLPVMISAIHWGNLGSLVTHLASDIECKVVVAERTMFEP